MLASQIRARALLFVNHWTTVNAGGTALVLKTGITLAQFQAKIDDLSAQISNVENREDERVVLVAQRDGWRSQGRSIMEEWRKATLYQLDGSALIADLPTLPSESASAANVLERYETTLSRWAQIDAATDVPGFTPPLITRTGVTRAQFEARVGDFRSGVLALGSLDDNLSILRSRRDDAAREVKGLFSEYRLAILANYSRNSPFVQTLPTINPPRTGPTPEPVVPSVTPDAAHHTTHATLTASEVASRV
ncbi:MAG TPA: hypothetical protein VGB77_06110 [Abditibacteriaceae bacterium]